MSQASNHEKDKGPNESTSQYAFNLPSRQSYFTTLSAIAFASGLGIAAVVTIRRGRKTRAEDIQKGLGKSLESITLGKSIQNSNQAKNDFDQLNESPLGRASSKGVFALFGEMNRSIFRKDEREETEKALSGESPFSLQKKAPSSVETSSIKGKTIQNSVFDASPTAPPPSVLMRMSDTKAHQKKIEIIPPSTETQEAPEMPVGDSPVVLAIKAIGIATAIVATTAWVSVQIACKIFKVNNTDELIEHLTTIIPSSKKNEMFDKIGKSARQSLQGKVKVHQDSDEYDVKSTYSDKTLRNQVRDTTDTAANQPLPVQEAMQQLDDAIERGDAAGWMEIMSNQLNAERRKDLQERQDRIEKASTKVAAS